MSLDKELVSNLLERIQEGKEDLEDLKQKIEDIRKKNDQLRKLLYREWDPSKFDPENPETYPPCLRDQEKVLKLLDQLNIGVGYAHKLVLEYRYPEQTPKPIQPLPAEKQEKREAPVIVQTAPQGAVEQGYRVRSFWTGWHERAIEKMRLQYLREQAERERERPKILTEKVVRDPVEVGNELLAALNETKKFITDCYLCWPVHRNWAYALNVHEAFRARVTKLLTTIESFTHAALELEAKEVRHMMIAQTSYFTRILEAQAQAPVTIQEITRPYKEEGWRDMDFEPESRRRRRL